MRYTEKVRQRKIKNRIKCKEWNYWIKWKTVKIGSIDERSLIFTTVDICSRRFLTASIVCTATLLKRAAPWIRWNKKRIDALIDINQNKIEEERRNTIKLNEM